MVDFISHMPNIARISRPIENRDSFTIASGQFAELKNGKVKNITVGAKPAVTVMVITSVTGNMYEGHDTASGRITTVEESNVRLIADSDIVDGTPTEGTFLAVSYTDGTAGKLVAATAGEEVKAKVMVSDAAKGEFELILVSPFIAA